MTYLDGILKCISMLLMGLNIVVPVMLMVASLIGMILCLTGLILGNRDRAVKRASLILLFIISFILSGGWLMISTQ